MDPATIFLGIVIVAVTAMVIYMFVDMNKYKESTTAELKQNDADLVKAKEEANAKLATEKMQRQSNVNYIIDKANEANQNIYTRFDTDVKKINTNLNNLNTSSAKLNSVMRVTSGTSSASGGTVLGSTSSGTAVAGRSVTELPGSGAPNLELLSSVMATNGLTVKNTTKTDKLQLGDKFLLSGVGDAHANDTWLRVFGKDGKGYYGGIAMNKLWTSSEASLGGATNIRGNLNIRGGTSEHNPKKWGTHFPYAGNNKNYIRGDTEIRGNTNNIGDLNVGRNANVQGRLHFSDPQYNKAGSTVNSSDSYFLQKVVTSPDVSSLRLTVNDNANESMEIWGNSCAAGQCSGPGTMRHKFDAAGNAIHTGALTANGSVRANNGITMPAGKTIASDGRLNINGADMLHVLNKNGMIVSKEGGANGNLAVQGSLNVAGNARVGRHIDASQDWGGKGNTLFAGWGSRKTVIGNNAHGAHNFALNQPSDTIVATNPVHVHGDINANRICTGDICLRGGTGETLFLETRDKTKTIGRFATSNDRMQLYLNNDRNQPLFYVNDNKTFGMRPAA